MFDLGGSLSWRLGGRVRTLLFEQGTVPVERGEILAAPPSLGEQAPILDGDDWIFRRPSTGLVEAGGARGLFVLGLLSMEDREYVELSARTTPGGLRFPDAAERTAEGVHVWLLDYRIEGQTLARTRGRTEAP